jgi:hypothetical protein
LLPKLILFAAHNKDYKNNLLNPFVVESSVLPFKEAEPLDKN